MQISRIRKAALFIFASISVSVYAQDSFPSISSIKSPEMPVISSPTIGSGFYFPSTTTRPAFTEKPADAKKKTQTASVETSKKSAEEHTKKELLNSLTAGDLSALDSLGLIKNLGAANELGNLYSSQTTKETKELLNKVLEQLEEIKANTNAPVQTSRSTIAAQDSSSKILRFNVNNYDVLRTCAKIYISDIQRDGTFLVTGDRRYTLEGKHRTETFHMLFKTSQDAGGTNYTTATSVTQDYLNEYSILYQLAQRSNLNAVRTGNLVTMRSSDDNLKLELLIDLGTK